MEFLAIFSRVFTSRALRHDAKTGNAISQSGDLVIQIGSISLLNHIMGGLLYWLIAILFLFLFVLRVGGRLALSRCFRRSIGGIR
jgi:hypothetical protein